MIVYRHRRLDTNEVFYVGIGSRKDRASYKKDRNPIWNNIINKTEYSIEIIAEDLDVEAAKELEIFLISLYGRRDLNKGSLCNLTDGGDIRVNTFVSEETRQKISKIHTGRKHSKEHIEKRRISNKQTKKVINIETGEIYYGVRPVAELLNIPYSKLVYQLNGKNINKTKFKYLENGS